MTTRHRLWVAGVGFGTSVIVLFYRANEQVGGSVMFAVIGVVLFALMSVALWKDEP